MNRSNYEKWIPLTDFKFDNVYDIDNIYMDNGLVVILIPDNINSLHKSQFKIRLHWESFISFNVTEESHKESLWINDAEDSWTFYKTKVSEYIEYVKKDSILFPKENITHFLLIGTNIIADVLSINYPTIEIV